MREAGAVSRADGVNTAFIILQVEELAGLLFIQPVPFLFPFFIQPLRFEFVNCFSKVRGNPLQISRVKGRGHGLATISAGKTVHFLPDFALKMHRDATDPGWWIFFKF